MTPVHEETRTIVESPGESSRLGRTIPSAFSIAVAVGLVTILVLPRLAPGVCYGDSGDLQLAAATLGIAHPPGYPGYASILHLFTYIPGIEPAYAVSLACLGCGLVVLWACALTQMHFGVHPYAASAISLLLTAHPAFWSSLIAPEVYMPSLALIAVTVVLVLRFDRTADRQALLAAALLFGILLANRPPSAFIFPFLLLSIGIARGRRARQARKSQGVVQSQRSRQSQGVVQSPCASRTRWRWAAVAVLLFVPAGQALSYVWLRDRPETPQNYIKQYRAEFETLPPVDSGASAKWQRAVWLLTGRQFHSNLVDSWGGLYGRWRWLKMQVPFTGFQNLIGLFFLVLGAVTAWRRYPAGCTALVGVGIGGAIFLCTYRIGGQAADILPVWYAILTLAGIGLVHVFPCEAASRRGWLAAAVYIIVMVATWYDAPQRRAHNHDASAFLLALDMPTLPQNAVICTMWDHAAPLIYAQSVTDDRSDVRVIIAMPKHWQRLTQRYADRPVFCERPPADSADAYWLPYRNLWRLHHHRSP